MKFKSGLRNKTLRDFGVDFIDLSNSDTIPTRLFEGENKLMAVSDLNKGPKVIIIAISAERTLQLIKAFKPYSDIRIVKLFSRHIKMTEQVSKIAMNASGLGIGTAHRIFELLKAEGVLQHLEYIVFDQSFVDSKKANVLDGKQSEADILGILALATQRKLKIVSI